MFLYKGKRLSDIRESLKVAFEEAGIPCGRSNKNAFVFHDIRHSVNTDMRKAGIHIAVIMANMGHEDPGMFFRYDTVDLEDLREAVRRLEAYRASVGQTARQNEKAETA